MSTTEESATRAHQAAQALLPWFVNATLQDEERLMVSAHLRDCAHCRSDVEMLGQLRAAPPALPAGLDPERALARLMPRLEAQFKDTPARTDTTLAGRLRAWLTGGRGWMPWALAGQAVVLTALAFQLAHVGGDARNYRALGNAGQPAAGSVVVMFQPDTRLADVQRIMHASGARIVDGPTVTGAYLLDVPDARQAQALASLRAESAVQLAEPLHAPVRP
ncbi:MAG: zf-HC2 domain-containing protein [Pseudomonadota bacterium]